MRRRRAQSSAHNLPSLGVGTNRLLVAAISSMFDLIVPGLAMFN